MSRKQSSGAGLSTTASVAEEPRRGGADRPRFWLAIGWSTAEPERIGETAEIPEGRELVLGREGTWHEGAMPALFAPRRQHALVAGRPPSERAISRRQLALRVVDGALQVRRIGRGALHVGGQSVEEAVLTPGRSLVLGQALVLLCLREPRGPAPGPEMLAFGKPDAFGFVGESAALRQLRQTLRLFADSEEHVLLTGESGTGKELAARMLHGLSSRAERPLVSRNAATLPAGLIDGELFGNLANYPNPGTPEREGLIGAADGSTLFLDEIGELSAELQAHLLRVLDAGGEYQRLGEDRVRRARFRLIAATNRDVGELKHDLAARLPLRVTMPGLGARRGDIPLLLRHSLQDMALGTPEVARRFFDGDPRQHPPRIAPGLVSSLLEREYRLGVRELRTLLWEAIAESPGDVITCPARLEAGAEPREANEASPDLSPDLLHRALEAHQGNVTRAAAALGLSRHALHRLLKKHDIDPAPLRG